MASSCDSIFAQSSWCTHSRKDACFLNGMWPGCRIGRTGFFILRRSLGTLSGSCSVPSPSMLASSGSSLTSCDMFEWGWRSRSGRGVEPLALAELRDLAREPLGLEDGVCETLCSLLVAAREVVARGDPLAADLPPSFPLTSARDCVTDNGEDVTGLLPSRADLPIFLFCAPRVFLLSDGDCSSRGTALVREDLRLPSDRNDVGPS